MDWKNLESVYEPRLIELRREFHRYPEKSEEEFETSRRIGEKLDRMGIPWRQCGVKPGEAGILAEIRGGQSPAA